MTFARFSTVIAVSENLISFLINTFGISRPRSVLINLILVLAGSMPCILGFNVWNAVHILGKGTILDFEDYIVSGFLLPLGSFIFLLFCVTGIGWGFDAYMKECNYGKGLKFSAKLKPYFQYILPVLLLLVFLSGVL